MVTVAVDVMGADLGVTPVVQGSLQALRSTKFTPIFVGDKEQILEALPKKHQGKIRIVHTNDYIKMHESATDALKRKSSSIYLATELVKNGEAQALVSPGHSGATMSLATLRLGRLKGILRPPLATLMPNKIGKRTLVLDVGANVDCDSANLTQFAIMGDLYARDILKIDAPKIGLLSNGEEESKGNKVVKETHAILKTKENMNFIGNVEGNDIFKGTVDVVVCDGFVGNTILKASEGVASSVAHLMKNYIKTSIPAITGVILMSGALNKLKKELDYAEYGGAPLIGINGCAIVSHGKSNKKAIKNACLQAIRFVDVRINDDIVTQIQAHKDNSQ